MTEKLYKMVDGETLELSPQEYTEFYARKAAYEAEAPRRNALAEIARLEAEVTQRRIREMTTPEGKAWMDTQSSLISVERAKL